MAEIFADTSGWANLADPKQPFHIQALTLFQSAATSRCKFVTTNYVMAEFVALLHSPLRIARPWALVILNRVQSSPLVETVHIDVALDSAAWQLLKSRPDKEWSLVDCASFVVMQQRGLTQALTSDHHFEQAGFVRLLR